MTTQTAKGAPACYSFWPWAWKELAEQGGPHLKAPRTTENLSTFPPCSIFPVYGIKGGGGKLVNRKGGLRPRVALDLPLGQHLRRGSPWRDSLQHTFLICKLNNHFSHLIVTSTQLPPLTPTPKGLRPRPNLLLPAPAWGTEWTWLVWPGALPVLGPQENRLPD